jgi:hypothetical protein
MGPKVLSNSNQAMYKGTEFALNIFNVQMDKGHAIKLLLHVTSVVSIKCTIHDLM